MLMHILPCPGLWEPSAAMWLMLTPHAVVHWESMMRMC